jgi:hypothetical protein
VYIGGYAQCTTNIEHKICGVASFHSPQPLLVRVAFSHQPLFQLCMQVLLIG